MDSRFRESDRPRELLSSLSDDKPVPPLIEGPVYTPFLLLLSKFLEDLLLYVSDFQNLIGFFSSLSESG